MTTTTEHPQHTHNRRAKVARIVDFLLEYGDGHATAVQVERFNDSHWERLARIMGEPRVPTHATREQVIAMLRGIEMEKARTPDDPRSIHS